MFRKLFLLCLMCYLVPATQALAQAGESSESTDLLQKGLAAYQSKQYAEARDDFQKLLDQTKPTPGLLNNLALTVYQLDQKPLALALWRKALSIQPGFCPARTGRDFLESKMQMRPLERDSLSLWLHRNLEHFTFLELLLANGILLGLMGFLWIRYWRDRRTALDEERGLPAFPVWTSALTLVFLSLTSLVVIKGLEVSTPRATIVSAKVSGRSLPADDSVGLFDLSGGSEVLVRRQQDGWLQVQNGEGNSGWVKSSEVFLTSEN